MVFDISKITGIGEYSEKHDKDKNDQPRTLYFKKTNEQDKPNEQNKSTAPTAPKAFLIVNKNTIEIRTDSELGKLLVNKYESVMESRYFGRGGIEIVVAGHQLSEPELYDLVRLSYNLS